MNWSVSVTVLPLCLSEGRKDKIKIKGCFTGSHISEKFHQKITTQPLTQMWNILLCLSTGSCQDKKVCPVYVRVCVNLGTNFMHGGHGIGQKREESNYTNTQQP